MVAEGDGMTRITRISSDYCYYVNEPKSERKYEIYKAELHKGRETLCVPIRMYAAVSLHMMAGLRCVCECV